MNFKEKTLFTSFLSVAALFLLLAGCEQTSTETSESQPVSANETADLVLKNAYVYTVDSARSVAEAVAIKDNTIVFVGSDADVEAFVDGHTQVRDLGGAMVMPGIHDMHIHGLGTVPPEMCDLDSQPYSLDDLVPFLQACISQYEIAPGDWLVVVQWNFSENNRTSESLPNMRAALDAVSTQHPIFMWGNDGHHGAANSAALALATNREGQAIGLNAQTLAGEFLEFRPMVAVDQNGQPSGGINESARALIRPDFMGDFLGANADPAYVMPKVAAVLAENGITSIQDAWVSPKVLAMYGWLEESGGMTFRVRTALGSTASSVEEIDSSLEALKVLRTQYEDSPLIEANAVKLFADAVLEGNPLASPPTLPVAAMLDGYKCPCSCFG